MYVEDLEQPLPSRVLYPESSLREANTQRFSEEGQECTAPTPRLRSSRMFKGKGKEVLNVERDRRRPLQLLDLPVDVLKDIVKGVTHTNDLTSLALCHSALHRLAIPHIYSRFDIVWPDTTTHAETRSGVDALTYGLATLVFAEELFDEAPEQRQYGNNRFASNRQGKASTTAIRRRRGNHYAQFTKKFSLGNGPEDWVKEYLITKEAGKMLGTLVAIAVARMRILETFIWDMPTGVLRDVWLALSSHGDREDGRPCRLEKVWVRWHDNISPDPSNPLPAPPPLMNVNAAPINTANTITPNTLPASQLSHGSLDHVENPSFSILPPLKSLSVLDIDELSYLDEMAVLIGKSCDKLRELRVGIAAHAVAQPWLIIWEGDNVQQIDRDRPTDSSLTIGTKRLGGVLGTLTGLVCDMREPKFSSPDRSRRRSPRNSSPVGSQPLRQAEADTVAPGLSTGRSATEHGVLSGITSLRDVLPDISNSVLPAEDTPVSPDQAAQDADSTFGDDPLVAQSSQHSSPVRTPAHRAQEPIFALPADALSTVDLARKFDQDETEAPEHENDDSFPPTVEHVAHESLFLKHRLQLTSLELERVPLSIPVLEKSIDWSRLTSLTLLHCQNHDQLWKTLRRSFAPVPRSPTLCQSRRLTASTARRSGKSSIAGSDVELEYRLKLTRIHTNTVSMSLISFLKDTLAPNSLEVLFLQEGRGYSSPVTVDQIFKGPLRRHRNSLTKVMIDSSEKGSDGAPSNSNRWRRWLLSREILGFICSGKMPRLRELGMAIDYRDWVSCVLSMTYGLIANRKIAALLSSTPAVTSTASLPQRSLSCRPRSRRERRRTRAGSTDCRHRGPSPGNRALLYGNREQMLRDSRKRPPQQSCVGRATGIPPGHERRQSGFRRRRSGRYRG